MKKDENQVSRSEKNARSMLNEYTQRVERRLGSGSIEAIVLVGSLTTGSYIAGPGSDVDQITVVHDDQLKEVLQVALDLLKEVEEDKEYGIPFARMVFFRHELMRLFRAEFDLTKENRKYLEVPVELLRIHETGEVVWGNMKIIEELPIPTREEITAFDRLGYKLSEQSKHAAELRSMPPRISAQVILTNAFRHYYYSTGESCSNKLEIALRMREKVAEY